MSACAMTRRSLLAAGAGAIAGGLGRPGGALGALAGPRSPSLSEQWVGGLSSGGATVQLARAADLIGVQWQGPAGAGLQVRFRGEGGSWSRWIPAIGCAGGHGQDAKGRRTLTVSGDPVWTGGTATVQLQASGPVSGVRLQLVDVSGGMGARRQARILGSLAALPRATPLLPAGPGQPPIIARRAWAQGVAHPRLAPGYGAVRMGFVHHTQNPNGYAPGEVPAMLRAIYAFHRYVNGWNDIGYNFVVDLYGRIFEARAGGIDEPVVGAHAGGYNLASTGVAVLGSFMSAPISPAAAGALQRLLAWKLAVHGVPAEGSVTVRVNPTGARYSRFPANAQVPLPRIAGHRDGDSTDCPGNTLYGELAGIRRGVGRLAGRTARATLALSPPTQAPGQPPTPARAAAPAEARTLVGTLRFLDGTPIAGARVALQGRTVSRKGEVVHERTLGEALTDPAGRWSLPVTLAAGRGGTSLRALCTGAGGFGTTISEPLDIPAPVSLTPPAAATPPSPPAAAPPAT
jgi:N-acetylmuramoyl-L-alanine amidase